MLSPTDPHHNVAGSPSATVMTVLSRLYFGMPLNPKPFPQTHEPGLDHAHLTKTKLESLKKNLRDPISGDSGVQPKDHRP